MTFNTSLKHELLFLQQTIISTINITGDKQTCRSLKGNHSINQAFVLHFLTTITPPTRPSS
uniref:Uncharacterized protein n=1 Tax=Rhizophora mucronata TaxID=61149 RepID=A0A2P2N6W5_RHIMU